MTQPRLEGFLTPKEVADLLRIPVQSVYTMAYKGILPAWRPGGRRLLRFKPSELERWINEGRPRRVLDPSSP